MLWLKEHEPECYDREVHSDEHEAQWGLEMKKQGIKVKFNKHNKWGTVPCCCEKGYFTKFGASTVFCFICNLFCCRRLLKTESFCKKYGWAKDCRTCNQIGEYQLWDKKDKLNKE